MEDRKRKRVIDIGTVWSEMFEGIGLQSGPDAHDYVEGVDGAPKPRPPATRRDGTYVNEEMERLGRPGIWRFEKTLYQNLHLKTMRSRRIVHVFTRVDDDGLIAEVRKLTLSWHMTFADLFFSA